MSASRHEKNAPCAASNLGGYDSAESVQTTTHEGAEAISLPTTIPARFRQAHESDSGLYLANEHMGMHIEAEEVILPHKSLAPVYNLRIELEETSIEELRDALEEALTWTHRVEAYLPISAEATK